MNLKATLWHLVSLFTLLLMVQKELNLPQCEWECCTLPAKQMFQRLWSNLEEKSMQRYIKIIWQPDWDSLKLILEKTLMKKHFFCSFILNKKRKNKTFPSRLCLEKDLADWLETRIKQSDFVFVMQNVDHVTLKLKEIFDHFSGLVKQTRHPNTGLFPVSFLLFSTILFSLLSLPRIHFVVQANLLFYFFFQRAWTWLPPTIHAKRWTR